MRDTRHIDVCELLFALGRNGDRVDHRVEAVERAAERFRLPHIAAADVHLRARSRELFLGAETLADQRADRVSAEQEPGDRVPPHETVRAGHRYTHQLTAPCTTWP